MLREQLQYWHMGEAGSYSKHPMLHLYAVHGGIYLVGTGREWGMGGCVGSGLRGLQGGEECGTKQDTYR